jgi:lipoprotein-anchoring transpeptidase ErfK/SrfK
VFRLGIWEKAYADMEIGMGSARVFAAICAAAVLGLTAAPARAWSFDQQPDANVQHTPKGDLPADADPYYSTPEANDKDVDFKTTTKKTVADPTHEEAGTLTINTKQRMLYLSQPGGEAIAYRIAVGRQGFSWKGRAEIGRKAYWPGWTPPPEMIARQSDLPAHVDGGASNPLGARALYLFQDKKDTLFRIHGTNEPKSIGKAVSSGCIRMLNADVIDLYGRVAKGTKVVVE